MIVDYGVVYVFHVYFDLCIVYGVGICVLFMVLGLVLFIWCSLSCRMFLFHESGCCLLGCYVV